VANNTDVLEIVEIVDLWRITIWSGGDPSGVTKQFEVRVGGD